MNISKWEKNISKTYNYEKIVVFDELKYFLSNPESYQSDFSPENISEGEISNDDFYAAYVFNEHEILNRDAIGYQNSGWTTTIVLSSVDKKDNITGFYVLGLNGFSEKDATKFFEIIFPKDPRELKNE